MTESQKLSRSPAVLLAAFVVLFCVLESPLESPGFQNHGPVRTVGSPLAAVSQAGYISYPLVSE